MNKEVEVVRINVPKFGDILTARPEKLSYNEYRLLRASQHKRLKERLKGFLVIRRARLSRLAKSRCCVSISLALVRSLC